MALWYQNGTFPSTSTVSNQTLCWNFTLSTDAFASDHNVASLSRNYVIRVSSLCSVPLPYVILIFVTDVTDAYPASRMIAPQVYLP